MGLGPGTLCYPHPASSHAGIETQDLCHLYSVLHAEIRTPWCLHQALFIRIELQSSHHLHQAQYAGIRATWCLHPASCARIRFGGSCSWCQVPCTGVRAPGFCPGSAQPCMPVWTLCSSVCHIWHAELQAMELSTHLWDYKVMAMGKGLSTPDLETLPYKGNGPSLKVELFKARQRILLQLYNKSFFSSSYSFRVR